MLLIEQGKPYYNFINSLKTEETKKEYRKCLDKFVQHYSIANLKDFLKLPTDEIEDSVISYITGMRERKLSAGRIGQVYAALKHFLSMNDIRLNWDKISKFKGEYQKKNIDEAYTHEQIDSLLKVCDIRFRVVTLIFASSAIRVGALPELKIKHLKRVGDIYQLKIYEGTNSEYITFSSMNVLLPLILTWNLERPLGKR